jgi:hypothetical protein
VRKAPAIKIFVDRARAVYGALVRVRLPRIFGLVLRNPRDSLCAVALMLAITAIVANGLFLQPGRHPAPIFAIRPLPVRSDEAAAPAVGAAVQMPRRRSPEADTPKPEQPATAPPARAGEVAVAKNDTVPLPRPRPDLANDAVNPLWLLTAEVQRSLNLTGYGPIRVTGILDDNTREGIARFERDHNLPVTGQNTQRLRHALGAVTGRSLD